VNEPSADLFAVAARQRAHRAFTTDDVSDEVVTRLLETATRAPSAENRQPWVFIVVRDPATREQIGALTAKAWELGGRQHSEGRLEPALLADVDQGALGGVATAPVLIVVAGDTDATPATVIAASIFPAAQNLMLAATALGLGSALTTLPTVFGHELRTLLALPDHVVPMAVIPVGHPARRLGPNRRRAVAESTHRDRYGNPW